VAVTSRERMPQLPNVPAIAEAPGLAEYELLNWFGLFAPAAAPAPAVARLRGHDSVAVFAVEGGTGRLSPVQWVPSGGRTPRFIALDPTGRFLYAANEDDDTISKFSVEAETGTLTPAGEAARTGSPVCIVFKAAS
jgi:Lactonase, 7-bladed beta-propeller/Tripartite tricarboxylate transporter family receptor